MIDVMRESLISLEDARRLFPRRRGGKVVCFSTVWRWTTVGYHGSVLESVRVAGTTCTSRESIARFILAMSRPSTAQQGVPTRATMLSRAAADEFWRAKDEARLAPKRSYEE